MATDTGDPACWLHRTCSHCGALIERPGEPCWRCGHTVTSHADALDGDASGDRSTCPEQTHPTD